MSSVQRNAKIYGAVETETFMTFQGFCKKIYDTTQQEIEIFIDDKKIDTLLANEKIPNIEDKYEVFDTNGFCFNYKLPKEYIGGKHKLEFKTLDGEQLVHSPIVTVDSSNEKYNEYLFLESLNEPIDTEKIKDIYCPNSIGFLATEENLEDKEFLDYIIQLMQDFPKVHFKALIFNQNSTTNVEEKFNQQSLDIVVLSDIINIFHNVEVYLSNNDRNELDTKILLWLRKHSSDVFCVGLSLNQKNITVKTHEQTNQLYFIKFFDNLDYLGFLQQDIQKYGNTFHEVYFKKACDIYGVDMEIDMNETISKAHVYWTLKLGLSKHDFFRYALEFGRKFAKL